MARIVPNLTDDKLSELQSMAEAEVYRKCRTLDAEFIVLFSVPWINVTAYGTPRDGETDFIVFHKTRGILVIEVKGGKEITFDPNSDKWTSVNFYDVENEIKNPFRQAHDSKHALIRYLRQNEEWSYLGLRPTFGHAVLLPDISDAKPLVGPDRPSEIVGTKSDLEDFSGWINSLYDYWSGTSTNSSVKELGSVGIEFVVRSFCKPIKVKPLLATVLKNEEHLRISLTLEQARTIAGLKQMKRASIAGGAGTGKTLLALERAKELAESGLETLLICFNQPLADQLNKTSAEIENLDAMSFHQWCSWFVEVAQTNTGNDHLKDARESNPGADDYFCLPLALAEAIPDVQKDYDAIVIDEAQDFQDEHWLPINVLVEDQPEKHLIIFFDTNQRLYTKSSLFPIEGDPYLLTRNCRNTKCIHDLAYQYYSGIETEASTIQGEEPEFISGPTVAAQAKKLHSHLVDLLSKQEVSPEDVCVLVPSKNPDPYNSLLESKSLPSGVKWSAKQFGLPNKICIETMMRFKGLEATYIYIWGADQLDQAEDIELLYVTFSRAKSRICIVGNTNISQSFPQPNS